MNKLFLRTLIVFGLFFCLGLITSCIGFNQGGSNETGGNKNNENENKHQHVECSHCGLCMDSFQ